ncbi:MAG: RNA polymerase sigma factor [Verrucomicrobiota bacterium JB022]|nr:RNA polymerase sigma factor [Verrucomicrobiota bacterium JB022]
MATDTHDSQTDDADVALMLRVRDGDDGALQELIERWKTPLINFFYRSLHSVEQAEDLAQLTFIRLYRAAAKYEPRAKFSTYLFYIARRLLINEFRRRQRKPLEAVDPAELHAVERGDEERNIAEIEEAFDLALERLPEKQRTAILLLKQQELSYAEIAQVMDATESAVKTWIFRARQTLKQELKDLV